MTCRNCGNKNDEDANFCSSCGLNLYLDHALETEEVKEKFHTEKPSKSRRKKKAKTSKRKKRGHKRERNIKDRGDKKGMPFLLKLLLAFILIIGLIGTGLYFYFSTVTSPEKIAKKYFEAKMSGDPSKLYPYYEVEESAFANQTIFSTIMKENRNENVGINQYQIGKTSKSSDGETATVTIEYTRKGNSTKEKETILLTKAPIKEYYLFDKWELSKQTLKTVKDFRIYVMKNAKVKLEGVLVNRNYIDSNVSTKTSDVYKVPTMFALPYKAQIELPLGFSIEEEIDGSSYAKKKVISIDSSQIPDAIKNKLEIASKEALPSIYEAAIADTSFENIKGIFDTTDVYSKNLQTSYETFMKKIKEEKNVLQQIKFTEITLSTVEINNSGIYNVRVSTTYEYSMVTKDEKEQDKTSTGTGNARMNLLFTYQDGSFNVAGLNNFKTTF